MVDRFTACTTTSIKDTILECFCISNSSLCVVVATIAFGMGLDCPNVWQINSLGPSRRH